MADFILFAHFAYVLAVVLPALFIPIGAALGWDWVRSRRIRVFHLGMMGLVAFEALAGITCPLTWLENELRGTHTQSFLSLWVSRLLFHDWPASYFTAAYFIFLLLLIGLWIWIPPHAGRKSKQSP